MRNVSIALVQTNSGTDMPANLRALQAAVQQAAAKGAQIVLTPENLSYMPMDGTTPAFKEANHPFIPAGRKLAAEHGVYLLLGSLLIESNGRKYNRSIFIDPRGDVIARYDKIHLFDVHLSATERHGESQYFEGGNKAVLAETPWGKFGLTVCYDLRFPRLFQALANAGAECFLVPAAFTQTTGARGHWETLLRARAIENRCFAIGIGQYGKHSETSHTYGHSMLVDPDGQVVAKTGGQADILLAKIDLDEVPAARASIPSLQNARPFEI